MLSYRSSIAFQRTRRTWMFVFALVLSNCLSSIGQSAVFVTDFDELDGYTDVNDQYFDGYGAGATAGIWTSQGVRFNTNMFGPGWSYSRVNDTTTPGFTNQWSAFTGTDASGTGNYALGTTFSTNGAFFELPAGASMQSVEVTNTTYAALSMRDGDSFTKQFGGDTGDDPDFFHVTFEGFNSGSSTGTVTFYLADYRFTDNTQDYIVDTWTEVDLSSLGEVESVGITFASSDVGGFGINTPVYVAIDNLTFTAVPEPSAIGILAMLGCGILRCRRRL